ncbi:hypothetical protein, partial [Prevotella sp. MGM2]|uniref:hypothetical protein n=1 Tax=Prevotella sp. MGM2 TaxID=2033406 RepID=UPI001CBEC464
GKHGEGCAETPEHAVSKPPDVLLRRKGILYISFHGRQSFSKVAGHNFIVGIFVNDAERMSATRVVSSRRFQKESIAFPSDRTRCFSVLQHIIPVMEREPELIQADVEQPDGVVVENHV